MSIELKGFQEKAVAELLETFLTLWKKPNLGNRITFQSPTGSGKTVMTADFLRQLASNVSFASADVAFIWITNSDDLAMQSKKKLQDYYDGAGDISLLTVSDVNAGFIPKNGVFFVNWQKLVQSRRTMRPLVLRTEGESNTTFDTYLANTHAERRSVVLIIDEEHIASGTVLANDLIDNVIKPRLVLGISATPQGTGAKVTVKREDVVSAGLIKEKTVFQTAEDLHSATESDQDRILLELALNKRNELAEKYRELGLENQINPLVLIQLPNDDQANRITGGVPKIEVVKQFLRDKDVKEHEIAVWLSDKKENLESVTKNSSPVSFLLFKQAAATGWDCPRASILVMFREIQNPVFAIQTVGRILRMPLGKYLPFSELNRGYLFTNYTRNEVLAGYNGNTGDGFNRPAVYHSYRKKKVTPFQLASTFIRRSDYNVLLDSFSATFSKIANEYFDITDDDVLDKGIKKLAEKEFDTTVTIKNSIVVNVEIDDYDNFVAKLQSQGTDEDVEMSYYDVERLYNLLLFRVIATQTTEETKFAPAKSWSKLKTALNEWFGKIYQHRSEWYRVVVKDLLKTQHSILAKVIENALKEYRPIYAAEVGEKIQNKKQTVIVDVPPAAMSFTDLFEKMNVNDSAMEPFYIEKEYSGKQNETAFIDYLENEPKVEWWYKNGEQGNDFFALPYFDTVAEKERLFYPDWFVKTAEKLWVLDTKGGWTAEAATDKGSALSQWLAANTNYAGGMVVLKNNVWKIISRKDGQNITKTLEL